jgi:hypothetical protein
VSEGIVEVLVLERDLEDLHSTLMAVKDYLQAQDIARCYMNMQDPIYSPLTQMVDARFNRVQGILKDHYSSQRLAALQEDPPVADIAVIDDDEPFEPLPPVTPAMTMNKPVGTPLEFIDDEEQE